MTADQALKEGRTVLTSGWLDGAIGSVVLKTAWERDFEITQREHAKK